MYPFVDPLMKFPDGAASLHSALIFDTLKVIIGSIIRPPALV